MQIVISTDDGTVLEHITIPCREDEEVEIAADIAEMIDMKYPE